MIATDQLEPEAPVRTVVQFLAKLAAEDRTSVALVAHEPILSAVAAALIGEPRHPALRKAEALRIRLPDGAEGQGSLRWRIDGGTGKRERLR
jgi:phosphohistidine phosphatase SixA